MGLIFTSITTVGGIGSNCRLPGVLNPSEPRNVPNVSRRRARTSKPFLVSSSESEIFETQCLEQPRKSHSRFYFLFSFSRINASGEDGKEHMQRISRMTSQRGRLHMVRWSQLDQISPTPDTEVKATCVLVAS